MLYSVLCTMNNTIISKQNLGFEAVDFGSKSMHEYDKLLREGLMRYHSYFQLFQKDQKRLGEQIIMRNFCDSFDLKLGPRDGKYVVDVKVNRATIERRLKFDYLVILSTYFERNLKLTIEVNHTKRKIRIVLLDRVETHTDFWGREEYEEYSPLIHSVIDNLIDHLEVLSQ